VALLLGIDTGGTYTDAVLLDDQSGVIASAKALTTKHDLSIGIRNTLDAVLPQHSPDIGMVSLSTTLATNAIVEGQTSPVCLLLLGYPADALELAGLGQALGGDPVVFIDGGHTVAGDEQNPLDVEAARRAILAHALEVAAFAVSGYFAVRNPAHELAVRGLVRELTGLPVTCGHELTSDLHAPRRALTTVLNARLIPLLQRLILSVRDMLAEKSIRAPLMVVKGDGSLIDAEVALERPVETILSGPAASVVGARHLSGEGDVFVVDMGGTTTDIALLHDGRPVLNAAGATVGGWQTMVEAIAVHTYGLGGDSEVRLDDHEGLVIGPRRVVPLSLLAFQFPGVIETLRRQLTKEAIGGHDGQFALRQRSLEAGQNNLTPAQREAWDTLADGPLSLESLFGGGSFQTYSRQLALASLVERGLAAIGGFTPTDAAHVLGYHHTWSAEAARLGADLWRRRASTTISIPEQDGQGFCRRVMQQVTVQLGRAAVVAALAQAHDLDLNDSSPLRRLFVDGALAGSNGTEALVDVALTLRRPLVAIGAPVNTYFPVVAERLHTRLCIPPHAEVANAVGAVIGSVVQIVRALIDPLPGDAGFRVHLPGGIRDFDGLEEAAAYATQEISRLAETQARRAGAADVQGHIRRKDHLSRSAGSEVEDVFIDTEVVATAIGRPRLAGG
jgi:N-methylhydantoinase A/oxoprolinase/acetone carboxylase beta subunit